MSDSDNVPSSLQSFIIENIQLGRQIGYGANGRILEAKWEGAVVAVKEIHSIFNQVSEHEFQAFKQSFLRECEQSNRLRHPNIVRFFGIYLPPGARLPSLVMERLHCSLNNLLEQTPVIPIGTKLSILYDVSLGIRYLHSRNPPIIHRDLSSNNVLLTKGMEAKIGDLGTARLVDPRRQSQMTKAPGTVDFMPPEALAANPQSVRYGRELDVFSFGCVMLHTLSHQWPTPAEPVVTDPVTFEVKGRTEVERRSQYFNRIDRSRLGVLIPLIESCLGNLPMNRTSIVTLCEQLEGLVDRKHVPTGDLDLFWQEIERKDAIIHDKDGQIQNQVIEIQTKDVEIHSREAEIQRRGAEIQRRGAEIQRKDAEIQRRGTEIQRKDAEIQTKDAEIQRRGTEIQKKDAEIQTKDAEIQRRGTEIQKKDAEIQRRGTEIQKKDAEIQRRGTEIQRKYAEIQRRITEIQGKDTEIQQRDNKIQRKNTEIHNKDVEIEALRSNMSKLQITASHLTSKQVSNRSTEFWNSLKLTWQQCADLPWKYWADSIVKLDNKVYIGGTYYTPCMYDIDKDKWFILPKLPYGGYCLVAVPDKKQLLAIGGVVDKSFTNTLFLWDEKSHKWLSPYPNMPTARSHCSGISHGSSVIVAGGVTSFNPFTLTTSVEVLNIKDNGSFSRSNWSVVKQLPYGIAIPIALIIDDKLYIAAGDDGTISCGIATISLQQLLQSTNSGQVWNKLPDIPYHSVSINHYQGHLIAFNGLCPVEHPGEEKPAYELVPLIHLYNPNTRCWDCVGSIDYPYNLGKSVHIRENKIMFVGGSTGTHDTSKKDDLVTPCVTLTINI